MDPSIWLPLLDVAASRSDGLLPHTGGFEGLVPIEVGLEAHDLPITYLKYAGYPPGQDIDTAVSPSRGLDTRHIVVRPLPDWPDAPPQVTGGRDELMRVFAQIREPWEATDVLEVLGDLVTAGDRVIARYRWKAEGHGPPMSMELTYVEHGPQRTDRRDRDVLGPRQGARSCRTIGVAAPGQRLIASGAKPLTLPRSGRLDWLGRRAGPTPDRRRRSCKSRIGEAAE
jgi:hypothetical protein